MNKVRRVLKIMVLSIIAICINKVYALTDDFVFTIETVGIPRYNSVGYEISEDAYIAYNVFVYSEPHKVTSSNQRWKNSNYGYWAKGSGRYVGYGTRGEYYVLGYTYSGEEIYNYYFPMDVIPTTTPDTWTFYTYPGAASSWQDNTMYKYEEQLTHMLKSKLMFNDITSRAKADNPAYIKEYEITAEEIGTSKVRLETAATWRTHGMVSTRRKISGVIYSQVYLIKPMAADADVNTYVETGESYTLSKYEEELLIPIKYGVEVLNLSGYANEKHIKEMKATLYVDGEKLDEISGSKIISVGNEYMLVITRDKIPPNTSKEIEIKIDGYMHTEFAVDGLLREIITKTVTVNVEPKQIIPVSSTSFAVLEKNKNQWVVRPLAQNIYTNQKESVGFIEAGRYLAVKLELAVDNVENIQIKIDKKSITARPLMEDDNTLVAYVKIPETMEPTLYGQESLRKEKGSYFNVVTNEKGTRKSEPYLLEIIINYGNEEYITSTNIDILDDYLVNMNTSMDVSNYESAVAKIRLATWLE